MSYLKHFGVANFKVFKEMTRFELAPITILTGKNNSGKSSLIKSMLLLRNSPVENKTANSFQEFYLERWDFDFPELKLGSPSEIFNYSEKNEILTFEYSFSNLMIPDGIIWLEYSVNPSNDAFLLTAFKLMNGDESVIEFSSENNDLNTIDQNIFVSIKIDFEYFIKRLRKLVTDPDNIDLVKLGKEIGLYGNNSTIPHAPIIQLLELLKSDLVILGFDMDFVGGKKIEVSLEEIITIQERLFKIFKIGFLLENGIRTIDHLMGRFEVASNPKDKIVEIFNQDEIFDIKYKSLCSHKYSDGKMYIDPKLHSFFNYVTQFTKRTLIKLQSEFNHLVYLPSIRARNERLYQVSKEGYALQAIDQKAFEKIDFHNEELSKYFKNALRDFEIGENIEIRTYQRSATEITIVRGDKRILLSDLGFGYAQLVPIILNIVIVASKNWIWKYAKNEQDIDKITFSKILIEEPESNLHPDFQSKLADLFVNASKLFGIQFIIETHSEYLLRRLQYLTARKDIKPDDISIYYFNNPNRVPKGEKQINKIEIRSDGSLSQNFGSGFFDEASNWKFELMRLKHEQKN